ncbi:MULTISPECIES: methyltransferase domain-containing protein [unclassified Mesorhizobium]|uniref:class I SAM-dependent methyltransferase n=1 Tax=unclassified Mesorhizobium TaxID=325217 RepID=UPI001FEE3E1C|nr:MULTISPECIES: methyltransferase domain-containing protein [unclassified Mesorhizobium]
MVDYHHWQLDGSAPELYEKYLVPAITVKWAEDLVGRAQPCAGEDVLDLACGTGIVARLASQRMGQGHVTGLDLNKGMLAVARTFSGDGAPIDWVEGSALDLPFPAGKFDLVLCQLGLQFFPDQGRALSEMNRVLSLSGRVALSVFNSIERTPGANAFVLALDRVLGPNSSRIKRGEHAFNEPGELRDLLIGAGLSKAEVRTVVQKVTFPSVLDYVRFQFCATPLAALLGDLTEDDRRETIKTIALEIAGFCHPEMLEGGRFSFQQEGYVGTAYASG